MRKTRQHHVFRYYLKPWAEDDQVWVLERGKIFQSNITNVAVEKEFYKLQEITREDIDLVKAVAIDSSPKHLQSRCAEFVEMFFVPVEARRRIDPGDARYAELRVELDEVIVNLEEDFHGRIEDSLVPALKDMSDGKVDFYFDGPACSAVSTCHMPSVCEDQEDTGGATVTETKSRGRV